MGYSHIVRGTVIFLGIALCLPDAYADSFYTERPNDPRPVPLSGAKGDGAVDDSDAIQQAIDAAPSGIVFIPDGRYRIGKTIHLWHGTRIIGYGAHRPVFVLGKNTPGYQDGSGKYMLAFADDKPKGNDPVPDASEFTDKSAVMNIDFDIEEGNRAAIAVRFHAAQNAVIEHADFHLGSAYAALEDVGNQASDIHIYGGRYGIVTKKTSAAWQFLLMDSSFEGQSDAAIRTQDAGLTLIRDRIAHTPVAVEIPQGQVEQLYAKDLLLENISKTAFDIGDAKNARSQTTLENIACSHVPHFLLGDTAYDIPWPHYVMTQFSSGLTIGDDGREANISQTHAAKQLANAPAITPTDIPPLPAMKSWVNVKTLGVSGDGKTDDTTALQSAIDAHKTLYFPLGTYMLSKTLTLKPDTVLIGLHPGSTHFVALMGSHAFSVDGVPSPLLLAPKGGTNIVTGLGIIAGRFMNTRASGILWMAGPHSMLDDMIFAAEGQPPQNIDDPQNIDVWVKDGGGGVFRGIWAHSAFGKSGLRVENTSTPSAVYQFSGEHHAHVETEWRHAENWNVYALQTEEENPAGADAVAADIQDSKHLLFANTFIYRVSRNVRPKPYAVAVKNSDDIAFSNLHDFSQTRLAFDNALLDETTGVSVRNHDFTGFTVNASAKAPAALKLPNAFVKKAEPQKIASGFSNVSGLTTDDSGRLYFTDAAEHKVYRYNENTKQAEPIAQLSDQPIVMGFVKPDTLMIVTAEHNIFQLNVKGSQPQQTAETPQPVSGTSLLLPVGIHGSIAIMNDMLEHRGYVYRPKSNTAILSVIENEHRGYFYAAGMTAAIMAGGSWRPWPQSSQMALFSPGDSHYLTSEDDNRTYLATLDGQFKFSYKLFAERGGNAVVTDADGNVYIAAGQLYVYDKSGRQTGILELPERPSGLAFGGVDGKTLFIGARDSLYSIPTNAAGNPR